MPCPGDDICQFIREQLSASLLSGGMDGAQVNGILDELDQKVRQEYGGGDYYVSAADKKRRNKALITEWRGGMQIPEIAKKYDVHVSTVYRVVNQSQQQQHPAGAGLGTEEWVL